MKRNSYSFKIGQLTKDTALEFCQQNASLPNCDIVIASNHESEIRPVLIAENDNFTTALDRALSDEEYPIRMINFE